MIATELDLPASPRRPSGSILRVAAEEGDARMERQTYDWDRLKSPRTWAFPDGTARRNCIGRDGVVSGNDPMLDAQA